MPAAAPTLRLDDEELDFEWLDVEEHDVDELDVEELHVEELDVEVVEELDAEELDVEELDVKKLAVKGLAVGLAVKIEGLDTGVLPSVGVALAYVYAGVPVDGRYCIVTRFSGAGAGKASSLGLSQSPIVSLSLL